MKRARGVFLHGFLGRPEDWKPVLRRLRGICDGMALPVSRTIRVGPGDVLVGYSMGGRLALAHALRKPVRALVLVSTSAGVAGAKERRARRRADAIWASRLRTWTAACFLEAWYRQPVFAGLSAKARRYLLRTRSLNPRKALARQLEEWGQGRMPSAWTRLSSLRVPVLWVAGERDVKYVRLARRMARLCPKGRAVIVRGSSHVVHRDQPARLARVIHQFLREIADE